MSHYTIDNVCGLAGRDKLHRLHTATWCSQERILCMPRKSSSVLALIWLCKLAAGCSLLCDARVCSIVAIWPIEIAIEVDKFQIPISEV